MLDLIFTNDKDIITVEIANDCLLPCDPYHPATVSSITSNKDFKDLKFENFYFKFKRGDYIALLPVHCRLLGSITDINQDQLGSITDINHATETFYNIIYRHK
ncbi:hypothetical protein JTB14_030207 [Gonioctena quinquepunctata]|nr:hypothetical protein JTB14_030207 [Gonioctena quinquepunctata]